MLQAAEFRRGRARTPHIEQRASLDTQPRPYRAVVFGRNCDRHSGKPICPARADRLNSTKNPGKYLPLAADLDARFDDVPNPGDSNFFPRTRNAQGCADDALVCEDALLEGGRFDLEDAGCVAKSLTQSDPGYGIICKFEPHTT